MSPFFSFLYATATVVLLVSLNTTLCYLKNKNKKSSRKTSSMLLSVYSDPKRTQRHFSFQLSLLSYAICVCLIRRCCIFCKWDITSFCPALIVISGVLILSSALLFPTNRALLQHFFFFSEGNWMGIQSCQGLKAIGFQCWAWCNKLYLKHYSQNICEQPSYGS